MILISVSELAELLNLTERRIQQLVKEKILSKAERGMYEQKICVQSYVKYLQSKTHSKNPTSIDQQAEKSRLLKAQADKAELEVQILEEKYIALPEIELIWSGLLTAFRAKMLSLPMGIARQLMTLNNDFTAITSALEQEVHQALLELSSYRHEQAADITKYSEDNSPTAEIEGKRVG